MLNENEKLVLKMVLTEHIEEVNSLILDNPMDADELNGEIETLKGIMTKLGLN